MFKQCLGKEETKEDHIRHGKNLSRIILIHHGMPKSPWPVFIRSKGSHENMIKSLTRTITRARKGKGSKCITLSMSYGELLPILVQNYGIFVIPARPRRPPYPKGYDINARCEYHGRVKGHSTEDCTTFKDKVQSLIDMDPTKFRKLVSGHQEH